ncbi:MAG: hypothetical protein WAW73_17215 [Rhodoferax sp.]
MQNAELGSGEDESPIANHRYQDRSERSAEIVLTRSSLVFSSPPHRDVLPLKGLQSIRVESGRNWGVIIALAAGMVLSLGCAIVFGTTIFLQTANAPVFMKTVPIGMLVIGLFLLVALVRFRSGYVRIVIQLDAGTRHYEVATLDQPLLDFVRKAEQAVSVSKK